MIVGVTEDNRLLCRRVWSDTNRVQNCGTLQTRQTATERDVPEIDERTVHVLESHVKEIEGPTKLLIQTLLQTIPIGWEYRDTHRGLQLSILTEE